MSNAKQDEIDRIFKRLSTIRAQPSLRDLGNEHDHDSRASWYKDDLALMEKCKAGMSRHHEAITF